MCQLLLLLKELSLQSIKRVYIHINNNSKRKKTKQIGWERERNRETNHRQLRVCSVLFSSIRFWNGFHAHKYETHYAVWLQPAATAAANKSSHQHKTCVRARLYIYFVSFSFFSHLVFCCCCCSIVSLPSDLIFSLPYLCCYLFLFAFAWTCTRNGQKWIFYKTKQKTKWKRAELKLMIWL